MRYSDLPACMEKRAPIAWALELHAGMSLPFRWGPFEIPPLAAGTFSLFEMAYVRFLQNPFGADHWDIMRGVYIALKREDAHALCQADRKLHVEGDIDFNFNDSATWSGLDQAAMELFAKHDPATTAQLFSEASRLSLWQWIDVSFSGYRMIHAKSSQATLEWIFGLDSLSSYVMLLGMVTNERTFEILWRVPVALGSHLAAAHAAANNPDAKVYRNYDRAHGDRLRDYIAKTENDGKLLYWQKICPDNPLYDLSEIQIANGGDKLVEEFCDLIDEVKVMTKAQRDERAMKILEEEGIE